MAAWFVGLLLLAPDPGAGLRRSLDAAGVTRRGLSILVARAGGPVLYRLAAKTPRIPASNQKVLTAAAALQVLGRDFSFKTVVARKDETLVVIGDGDPNLSGRFFDGDPAKVLRLLAADLKKRGVASADGLVIDASRFDGVYVHPEWPKNQLDKWYAAPVAALVFNDSCWDVTVAPGARIGEPAQVTVQPLLLAPPVKNRCTTVLAGAKTLIHIGRAENGGIEVRGQTNYSLTGHLAVRDPVAFFAQSFRAALAAEGIEVKGEMASGKLLGAKPVVVSTSPLDRTLKVMLTKSQNLYAECLFKRIGDGTFPGGARAMLAALRTMGVDVDGVVPVDGSGLARSNRVTARAMLDVLQKLRDEPHFVNGLATGGTGTLRRRYRSLGERIRAKTGTIRGVSTLSGYVTAKSGARYVFVVLANGNPHARRAQDLVVKALADA